MEKSYVKYMIKKGVSQGSSVGFELDVCLVQGDSKEMLIQLGKDALAASKEIMEEKI